MINIKRENIKYDPATGKLATFISMKLIDGNGMMLKAKAELYSEIMDGLGKLIEAKIAEFAERYGEEVIRFAHNNTRDDLRDTEPHIKFVDSKEIDRKLLERAFSQPLGEQDETR